MPHLTDTLRAAGFELFALRASYPKPNAQRNLADRTHYADDDTLRFHKSRIISARELQEGALFALIESYAMDYENTRRAFRYVVFGLDGTVISHVDLDGGWRTSDQARKAMWAWLEGFDTRAHYAEMLTRKAKQALGAAASYQDAAEALSVLGVAQ